MNLWSLNVALSSPCNHHYVYNVLSLAAVSSFGEIPAIVRKIHQSLQVCTFLMHDFTTNNSLNVFNREKRFK